MDCCVWNPSTGRVIPDSMLFETFLNTQINTDNQQRRAKRRRSGSPIRNDGAFNLQVAIFV